MRSFIRRCGYFSLDAITGGRVRKHLDDLVNETKQPQAERSRLREARLAALLEHAKKTVPYYKRIVKGRGIPKLHDFPVLTKAQISEFYDDFLSVVYSREQLIPVTTSGSYGTPFTF